jgi:hypothetical protein
LETKFKTPYLDNIRTSQSDQSSVLSLPSYLNKLYHLNCYVCRMGWLLRIILFLNRINSVI